MNIVLDSTLTFFLSLHHLTLTSRIRRNQVDFFPAETKDILQNSNLVEILRTLGSDTKAFG